MRRTAPLLVALAMVVVAHLWIPRPVAACSCVAPIDSLQMAAQDPSATIFTATTGPTFGDQMQVLVTRWFRGQPIAGIAAVEILLGDSAACGMSPLPAGRGYLFMTYPSETSPHALSSCSLQADLETPDGQAILARAIGLYGAGVAPPTDAPPTDPPAPTAPSTAPGAGAGLGGLNVSVPIVIAVVSLMGIILGLYLVLGRRRGST